AIGRELAIDQIRPAHRSQIGLGGPPRLPTPLRPDQALGAHQPRSLVTAAVPPFALQSLVTPPIPIGPIVVSMHLSNPSRQLLVTHHAVRSSAGGSLVIRGR